VDVAAAILTAAGISLAFRPEVSAAAIALMDFPFGPVEEALRVRAEEVVLERREGTGGSIICMSSLTDLRREVVTEPAGGRVQPLPVESERVEAPRRSLLCAPGAGWEASFGNIVDEDEEELPVAAGMGMGTVKPFPWCCADHSPDAS